MKAEGGWVYPENWDDVRALGVIQDGDEFLALGGGSDDDYWSPFVNSVGQVLAHCKNHRVRPLFTRRPLAQYHPPEDAHFI